MYYAKRAVFIFVLAVLSVTKISYCDQVLTLSALQQRCFVHPEHTQKYPAGIVGIDEFERMLEQYACSACNQLQVPNRWLSSSVIPEKDFCDINGSIKFVPYVQKLVVPAGSEVAMWGDLHGSVHSLLRCLQRLNKDGFINDNFEILKPNFYMLFLGDFVDRGQYGVEVIYTLMRLKIANPERIFLVRGNHEDYDLNCRYGFHEELLKKFPDQIDRAQKVYRLFDMLPVALYLGCGTRDAMNYVQCCHGGMEIGFDPKALLDAEGALRFQWLGALNRAHACDCLPAELHHAVECEIPSTKRCNFVPQTPTFPNTIGFMWNDFIVDDGMGIVNYRRGRGWAFGRPLTSYLLHNGSTNKSLLRGVFRAHQHNGTMLQLLCKNNGIVSLWDGMVYTLLSAPASDLGFNLDSFIVVTTAERYEDCTLRHCFEVVV